MNVSTVDDNSTARTDPEVAKQRAENLAIMGVKSVLELCVGPSFNTLNEAYTRHGIELYGNDIAPRWHSYSKASRDKWRIGDCFNVSWTGVDAVVFAPPLSKGCTGRREDSLGIKEIKPDYFEFLSTWRFLSAPTQPDVAVMVLPARAWANRFERSDFYLLLSGASRIGTVDVFSSCVGRRRIRKYIELYIKKTRYALPDIDVD